MTLGMVEYAIRITRLSYSYPDGTRALSEIDLDVQVGERVGLIGPSGAGKSTLLLHLNGVLVGSGTVRVMGQLIDEKNLREIRRQVGLVFQDPNDQLFCPTIQEDVAFGPMNLSLSEHETEERVEKALRDVGLDRSFRTRASHHLSLGERKRVAVATVLAMEPAILALDEPTSNLDPRNRRHLIELIGSIPATLLLATHDLDMVLTLCSRSVLLDQGKIWAEGETKKILADRRLMEDHGLETPPRL